MKTKITFLAECAMQLWVLPVMVLFSYFLLLQLFFLPPKNILLFSRNALKCFLEADKFPNTSQMY